MRVPLSRLRRTVARNMATSWAHIPHVTLEHWADITNIEEMRQHGLWFLNAYQPDAALVLFRRAAAKGDAWSALAIGAMLDPIAYEAEAFGPGLSRVGRPSADAAMCWYRRARELGAPQADVRIQILGARGTHAGRSTESGPGPGPASADCERETSRSETP